MKKDYMLSLIEARLAELLIKYKEACNNKSIDGRQFTQSGAACTRSRLKRDICLLKLVYRLLNAAGDIELNDLDAISGFEKLVKM